MTDNVVANETVTAPQETVEGVGAQTESLDDLLNQYSKEFDTETAEPQAQGTTDDVDKERIKAFMEKYEREETDRSVKTAAQTIINALGNDVPVSVTEDFIIDLLHGKAARDRRFLNAYMMRNQKPEDWNKVLKGYAGQLKKDFGTPIDRKVTDDVEAVATSIRGRQTSTEDNAPNFTKMSDRDFQNWKMGAR